jgi:hypothetical protein
MLLRHSCHYCLLLWDTAKSQSVVLNYARRKRRRRARRRKRRRRRN